MLQNELHNIILRSEKIGGFDSSVAAGQVPGFKIVNKFGGGFISSTERTIWDGMAAADYPYKYTNTTMTAVSDNVLDTGQKVCVQYLEITDGVWLHKNGVLTTDGTTPVTIEEADEDFITLGTNANIAFPFRIINKGTGQGTGDMAGTLTVANGGTTYGQIINGFNQSLMAIYPVPTGYSAIIHSIGRSVVGADKASVFTYSAIPFGECRQAKRVAGLISGSEYETFDLPYFFGEKTILEVRGLISSSTAVANAWFDLFLIDNTVLAPPQD